MRSYKNVVVPLGILVLSVGFFACSKSVESVDCVANPNDPACLTSIPATSSSTNVNPTISSSSVTPVNSFYGIEAYPILPDYAKALYAAWYSTYYISVETQIALGNDATFASSYPVMSGLGRIMWDASGTCKKTFCTVSEGIGYGMIGAMFYGDWTTFYALWNYHKMFRSGSFGALMDWRIWTFFGQEQGQGFAADADYDVATALIIAYHKTGDATLLADAQQIMTSLWNYSIVPGTYLIKPGAGFPATEHNPSYFSPLAFRLFAAHDSDPSHAWAVAMEYNYAWLALVQANSPVGLFPEWANDAGVAIQPTNNPTLANYNKYAFEGLRIPFRLAWDYNWYGDARDAAMMNKMTNFIIASTGGDPSQMRLNYSTVDGAATVAMAKMGLLSSFCVAGMADPAFQNWVNACNNIMVTTPISATTWTYWNHILQMMYSQLVNGMFVKPAGI